MVTESKDYNIIIEKKLIKVSKFVDLFLTRNVYGLNLVEDYCGCLLHRLGISTRIQLANNVQ